MRISDWSSDVCSSDLPPPTAIFASNDDMAAAAVAVAHRRGVDVPGDLSICGFDDTPFATTIWPALTTIHQPIADMSRAAPDQLVAETRQRRSGTPYPHRRVLLDYSDRKTVVQGRGVLLRVDNGCRPTIKKQT